MIELRDHALEFSFPEVHPRARCQISFQRTLRIPDDNQPYPLPAGLGRFPLHHVDDYYQRLPASWEQHGGVFLPLYQSEALWLNFSFNGWPGDYPRALKVATGKINAISGEPWGNGLVATPQDYLVVTSQLWLDGFAVGQGLIRQFVAMPLGAGFSAEEQLTGQAAHGGMQLVAYPMKRERFEELEAQRQADRQRKVYDSYLPGFGDVMGEEGPTEMALSPGGLMRQQIERDPYGLDAWDQSAGSRCFVHLVNSQTYAAITGQAPPHPPLTAEDYAKARMPWFENYHENNHAVPGSAKLAGLDSVAAQYIKKGGMLPDNKSMVPERVINLNHGTKVREGQF